MVAVALIVAETPVVYLLGRIAPEICLGAVYLVGVLVVSSVWGLALGVVTAVLSAAAFGFLYVASALYFVASDPRGPVALTIVPAVAVELCSVAAPARLRSIGADERRGDADPAAMMARLLLRTDDLRCALPGGSGRLGRALTLSAAAIELEAVAGESSGRRSHCAMAARCWFAPTCRRRRSGACGSG